MTLPRIGDVLSNVLLRLGVVRPRLERPRKERAARRWGSYDGQGGPRSTVRAGAAGAAVDQGAVTDASGMELVHSLLRGSCAVGRARRHEHRADHAKRGAKVALHAHLTIEHALVSHGLGHLVGPMTGGRWPMIGRWSARTVEIVGGGLLTATALGLDVANPLHAVIALGVGGLIGLGLAVGGEHLATVLRKFETSSWAKKTDNEKLFKDFPDICVGFATFLAGLFGMVFLLAMLTGVTMARITFHELEAAAAGVTLDPALGFAGGLLTIGGMLAGFGLRYASYHPLTAQHEATRDDYLMYSKSHAYHMGLADRFRSYASGQASVNEIIRWRLDNRIKAVRADVAGDVFVQAGEPGVDEALKVLGENLGGKALEAPAPAPLSFERSEEEEPFPEPDVDQPGSQVTSERGSNDDSGTTAAAGNDTVNTNGAGAMGPSTPTTAINTDETQVPTNGAPGPDVDPKDVATAGGQQ